MKIEFTKRFSKQYDKSPEKIKKFFDKRLKLFISDKFDPVLHNHYLRGNFEGYRSINITGDWRAIFRELDGGEIVYFDLIGTHSQLYK